MKIVNSSHGKGHPVVWIGVFVLAVAALAAGWSARLLMKRPVSTVAPTPVRAKIKLPPPPAAPLQQGEKIIDSTHIPPKTEANTPSVEAATHEDRPSAPASGAPVANISTPPLPKATLPQPASRVENSAETAAIQPKPKALEAPAKASEPEGEGQPVAPARQEPVEMHMQPDTAPQKAGVETAKPFSIQVGAFRTKAYADQRMLDLSNKGYDSFVSVTTNAKQQTLYLVRVGHFENRQKALDGLAALKEKEKTVGIVVNTGSR